ncbi:MAG: arginine--tRNA ligase [Patescibacteria group bacterium]|nr:arginine--tRNA ligase [Patescibacteria group bacterium]
MYTLEKIKQHIVDLVNKEYDNEAITIADFSFPPNSEMGDLSLPCFKIAKITGQAPAKIAEDLFKKIKPDKIIAGAKIFGPYLNFIINKNYLSSAVITEIEKAKDQYGNSEELKRKKIMVEFAHPNPFKSFHIGHLRNIILGESLVRIFEARGAKVIRTNYQGDVGMHIAKCLYAFKDVKPENYPESADDRVALLGKCYAAGAKAFEEDEVAKGLIKYINKQIYLGQDKEIKKLWELGKKWSLEKFHEIYERVDTRFDREYMESEIMNDGLKYIQEAFDRGILEKSDGAVVFNGEKHGGDTRVFLNSDGLPTYEGKELGLAFKEFTDFGKLDLCVHNVAIEQISFFKTTFKVEELLAPELFQGKQYHNAYEFVGLKQGKMSSRKGQVVLGNDILNEAVEKIGAIIKEKGELENVSDISERVGVGAVKFAFLKISPFKYLAFDINESISFEGNSGPYLQYTYVRIQSILRKVKGASRKVKGFEELFTEAKEHDLILKMSKYPEIVEAAGKNYDPSEIAKYLFELAQMFNDYYHAVPILKAPEEIKNARLVLIKAVGQIIENGLKLLGIKVVEEM